MNEIILENGKKIGGTNSPFIIAEIGNNHNGDIEIAKKLIEIASQIGVDAVKFQVKDIESSFSKELLEKPYNGPNSFGKTYREHKEFLEFNKDQLKTLYEYSRQKGIICFSTPFDIKSVELLENLNNPIYKISSFHVTDIPLIKRIIDTKKPVIMSTGMSTIEEISKVYQLFTDTNNLILLQCTSSYPTNDEDVNLKSIITLREKFDVNVGYSGHERGTSISAASVMFGASVIERHFTLDRTMKGPDHAASLEPEGMKLLIDKCKRIFNSIGSGEKNVLPCEFENRKKFRGY